MCTLFHCFLATPKEEKEEKMKWMWRHKSLGVLTGMVVAPRLAYRLFNIGKVRKVIMNNILLFILAKNMMMNHSMTLETDL